MSRAQINHEQAPVKSRKGRCQDSESDRDVDGESSRFRRAQFRVFSPFSASFALATHSSCGAMGIGTTGAERWSRVSLWRCPGGVCDGQSDNRRWRWSSVSLWRCPGWCDGCRGKPALRRSSSESLRCPGGWCDGCRGTGAGGGRRVSLWRCPGGVCAMGAGEPALAAVVE